MEDAYQKKKLMKYTQFMWVVRAKGLSLISKVDFCGLSHEGC